MQKYQTVIVIIASICISYVLTCELESQTQHGCKIENSQCVCGFGCISEYRYTTRRECQDALKVKINS